MSTPVVIHARWPVPDNVIALTSTRRAGESLPPYDSFNLALHVGDDERAVSHNRQQLSAVAGITGPVQWLQQVHGIRVVNAGAGGGHCPVLEADAVILDRPGAAGAVLTADCLPVFLVSCNGHRAAAIHAGWRGLAAGVLQETIAALLVPPDQLIAWMGPAIGPCHFEVGAEVRQAFMDTAANDPTLMTALAEAFEPVPGRPGSKWMADLYALAEAVLRRAGVTEIHGGGYCTQCDARFYSYRQNPVTGRMASLICLKA